EGDAVPVLQACAILAADEICTPILLGPVDTVRNLIAEHRLDELDNVEVIDPRTSPDFERYAAEYFKLRERRGITARLARRFMERRSTFAAMMVRDGKADGMVLGHTMSYPEAIRPPLQILRTIDGKA